MVLEKTYEQYTTNDTESVFFAVTHHAQTFTVGTVGDNENFVILKVRLLQLKNGSPTGNSKIEIRTVDGNGDPTNTILADVSFDVTALSTTAGGTWEEYTFTNAAELSASTQYALSISRNDGTSNSSNDIRWRIEATGTYGGGNAENSDDEGITWTASGGDFNFQLVGNVWDPTICEYNDVIGKAGANVLAALSTGAKFQLMNSFALQAQSRICAITRFDWVAQYSSLTANVKEILNDVCSNIAGIYAIAHDMSGYTDRVEAETMINVHRDAALQIQGLLRNQEVRRFIVGDT
tara:strand:+ start:9388 stop:10266 length:879 start_codon:yes stop_codon:yes gene_type:complete